MMIPKLFLALTLMGSESYDARITEVKSMCNANRQTKTLSSIEVDIFNRTWAPSTRTLVRHRIAWSHNLWLTRADGQKRRWLYSDELGVYRAFSKRETPLFKVSDRLATNELLNHETEPSK